MTNTTHYLYSHQEVENRNGERFSRTSYWVSKNGYLASDLVKGYFGEYPDRPTAQTEADRLNRLSEWR